MNIANSWRLFDFLKMQTVVFNRVSRDCSSNRMAVSVDNQRLLVELLWCERSWPCCCCLVVEGWSVDFHQRSINRRFHCGRTDGHPNNRWWWTLSRHGHLANDACWEDLFNMISRWLWWCKWHWSGCLELNFFLLRSKKEISEK